MVLFNLHTFAMKALPTGERNNSPTVSTVRKETSHHNDNLPDVSGGGGGEKIKGVLEFGGGLYEAEETDVRRILALRLQK